MINETKKNPITINLCKLTFFREIQLKSVDHENKYVLNSLRTDTKAV